MRASKRKVATGEHKKQRTLALTVKLFAIAIIPSSPISLSPMFKLTRAVLVYNRMHLHYIFGIIADTIGKNNL